MSNINGFSISAASGEGKFVSLPPDIPRPVSFEVKLPLVATGTSLHTYSVFSEEHPSNPGLNLRYQSITATYKGVSLEELRVQAYQQNGIKVGTTSKAPFGAFPTSRTNLFGALNTTQSTTGPIFGGDVSNTFIPGGTSEFPKPPVAGPSFPSTNVFGPSNSTSSPSKLWRVEDILRKSLLGEELVDTQFHLFSAKSSSSGQVMKPRVVCANNLVLAEMEYFSHHLLSSDAMPSDLSLVDFSGDDDIPCSAAIDDYGYESDSDLEDCDDSISIANLKVPEAETPTKDGRELSEDGFESVGSDTVVVKTERPGTDEPLSDNKGNARAVASNEWESKNQTAMRLRSLGSRHVLVKDAAFQTWYTLFNYLYTGKFSFLPLSSTIQDGKRGSSLIQFDIEEPKCSAKSIYRLACKVGLDHLRCVALTHIRWNLTQDNILKEISSSLASKHPELLEMELDMLYSYIALPTVVANFGALVQRVAWNELPHGADIMMGIHTRFLKQHYPFSMIPLPTSAKPGAGGADAGVEDRDGPAKRGVLSGTEPPESAVCASCKEPIAGGKVTERRK